MQWLRRAAVRQLSSTQQRWCALHQLFNESLGYVDWYPRVSMCEGACVQYWLRPVQCRHVGAFKKFSDWNLFIPKQRLSHGGHPVRVVVRWIVFELFHAWAEPLVGVVVVIGDARAEDIQERETLVPDALLDQSSQVFLFRAEPAGNERGARGKSQRNWIYRRFDVAEGHAFRLHADAAGGRCLAGGEAIDLVVHHDVEQVNVAAHAVHEVIATDAEAITVAARHQYGEIMIRKFHSSGYSQSPTVQGVHAVSIDEAGKVGRTADTADGDHVVVRYPQLDQGLLDRGEHTKIAASWTPIGIHFTSQVGQCHVVGCCWSRHHFLFSSNQDFMCRYRELGFANKLFLYCFDDVVWHEWFPIVLSYIPIRHEAGFAAQVASELAAVVVLYDDRAPRAFEDVQNRVAVQRHEPADLELVGRNALLGEDLTGLLNHSLGRAPADQRDIGIARTPQLGRGNRDLDAGNLPHALFHHGAALCRIREFVADQDAIFIVFVTCRRVRVARNARDGARGNTAFCNLVPLVDAVAIGPRGGCGDQFPAIDDGDKVQVFRIDTEPAFRQQ